MTSGALEAALRDMAPWVLRLLLSGALVTGAAHLLGWSLLRGSAPARVLLWRSAVLALLLLPALAVVSPWSWTLPSRLAVLASPPSAPEPARFQAPPAAALAGDGAALPAAEVELPGGPAVPPAPAAAESFRAPPGPVAGMSASPISGPLPGARTMLSGAWSLKLLAMVWLAGACWLLLQLVAGLVALYVHARHARDVTLEFKDLLPPHAVRGRRRVRVLRGGPFRVPVCWGVFRPRILLPPASERWSRERARAVILHEAAHVTHWDGLHLILARAACALHWPNPLTWTLLRRLSLDAEAACDSAVVRAGVPAREYARVLVEVAAEARTGRRPEAALAMALLRTGTLTWRVTRILDARALAPARRGVAAAATAALLLVTVVGATATVATAPQAEAETDPAGRSGEGGEPDSAIDPATGGSTETGTSAGQEIVAESGAPSPASGPASEALPVDPDAAVILPQRPLEVRFDPVGTLSALTVPERRVPDEAALRTLSGMSVGGRLLETADEGPLTEAAGELGANPPPITARIRGRLVDARNGSGVSLARVIAVDERGETLTSAMSDAQGEFVISVPAGGAVYLNASALGYEETTMGVEPTASGELEVEFPVRPSPLPVTGLVVERHSALTANGFYGRLAVGGGHFLTPAVIESARGRTLVDLLEALPRVEVTRAFGRARVAMQGIGGRCQPRVFLDGLMLGSDQDLDAMAPLRTVDAVEVYTSPVRVPLQWAASGYPGTEATCGAVVIWTRG